VWCIPPHGCPPGPARGGPIRHPSDCRSGGAGASALPGAILGVPLGIGLFAVANGGGAATTLPPAWWLAAAVLGILLAVAGLTAIPARIGARRPVAEILQAETA
jgi:hypothetical protein